MKEIVSLLKDVDVDDFKETLKTSENYSLKNDAFLITKEDVNIIEAFELYMLKNLFNLNILDFIIINFIY